MKVRFFFFGMAIMLLSSCTTTRFYQIYKVEAVNLQRDSNRLFYEDESCILSYNLWSNGGNVGFKLYNKTDENIYLNLEECFFVKNGIAYDYFRNREIANSDISSIKSGYHFYYGYGISSNAGTSSTKSVSVNPIESKVIVIPPKAAKIVAEYSVSNTLLQDCGVDLYPSKSKVKPIVFTQANSPITFTNRLCYTLGILGKPVKIENQFYITEIVNKPYQLVETSESKGDCGELLVTPKTILKDAHPDMFYIKYDYLPGKANKVRRMSGEDDIY